MADHSGRKQGGGSQVSNTPFNAITPPPIQSLPTTVTTTSDKRLLWDISLYKHVFNRIPMADSQVLGYKLHFCVLLYAYTRTSFLMI